MDYHTLHLLFRCSKEFSHEKIRLKQFSSTECMICSYIYSHENCSQDEVASALRIDKTTIGKAIASLEKKNCVVRAVDGADRRIRRLKLSDTGHEKTAELVDLHNIWLREIMKCLSEEEQGNFENYCERLLASAEKLTQSHSSK